VNSSFSVEFISITIIILIVLLYIYRHGKEGPFLKSLDIHSIQDINTCKVIDIEDVLKVEYRINESTEVCRKFYEIHYNKLKYDRMRILLKKLKTSHMASLLSYVINNKLENQLNAILEEQDNSRKTEKIKKICLAIKFLDKEYPKGRRIYCPHLKSLGHYIGDEDYNYYSDLIQILEEKKSLKLDFEKIYNEIAYYHIDN